MSKLKTFVSSRALKTSMIVSGVLASASSFADDTTTTTGSAGNVDLSSLTSSINFTGVTVAVMAIAGSIVALYATYAGVKHVIRMVKSA